MRRARADRGTGGDFSGPSAYPPPAIVAFPGELRPFFAFLQATPARLVSLRSSSHTADPHELRDDDAHRDRSITSSRPLMPVAAIGDDHLRRHQQAPVKVP